MNGYAAFAVNRRPDEIIEYLVCLPHQGQRLRAHAELGGTVLVTEQNLTGVVESLGNNDFRCTFATSELPSNFEQEQLLFISKGTFVDSLIIHDGIQLFNLNDDEYSVDGPEEVFATPSIHYIGSPIRRNAMEDVLASNDLKALSDAINNLPGSYNSKSDRNSKKLAESDTEVGDDPVYRRKKDDNEDSAEEKKSYRRGTPKGRQEEPENDYEDEEREEKESRQKSRRSNNSRSHSTREHFQEDESDNENEDNEEDESKPRMTNRRSRNEDEDDFFDDEDDSKPQRNPKARRGNEKNFDNADSYDEVENDDDYDNLDNSGNGVDERKRIVRHMIAIFFPFVLMF